MELQTSIKPTTPKKIKLNFKDSKYATGRRKRSIAKVWIKKGTGLIHVNGKNMQEYFKRPVHQIIVLRPLELSNVANNLSSANTSALETEFIKVDFPTLV